MHLVKGWKYEVSVSKFDFIQKLVLILFLLLLTVYLPNHLRYRVQESNW